MSLPLMPEARELVKKAKAVNGHLHILENDQDVRYVSVGQDNYLEGPQQKRRYLDALKELIEAGLAEHVSGVLYELTTAGWDLPEE